MTVAHADSPDKICCAECDNDTFQLFVVGLPSGVFRVTRMACAVCGDETDITELQPRDLVNA